MACELCMNSLNFITRKKCSQCQRIHCSKCSHRLTSSSKVCALCFRLLSLSFSRQDLDQYTVKELRHFLNRNNLRTDNFKERADLVEAVMKLKCPRNQASCDAEHERHVKQLKERMMRENSDARSTTSSPSATQLSANGSDSVSALPSMPSLSSQVDESIPTSQALDNESSLGALPDELEPSVDESAPMSQTATSTILPEPSEITSPASAGLTSGTDSAFGTPNRRITLSQLSKEGDIGSLSIRQLKELLLTNYVDYKGCCERQELMERVRRLWLDDQKNRGLASEEQSSSDIDVCKVCMDAVIDCILLECGHMVTCTQCGKRMAECPICRHYVSRVVHVFKV